MNQLAKRDYLKHGQLIAFFCYRVIGYSFDWENNQIKVQYNHFFGKYPEKILSNPPYPMDYFKQCFKAGYHLNHPSTKKSVKRDVFTIHVTNDVSDGWQTLKVVTINPHAYTYLQNQYDAVQFIPDRQIKYDDKSIYLIGHASGIGQSKKTVKFDTILDYEAFKDIVTIETTS